MIGVTYHDQRRRLSSALNDGAPIFWRPHALKRARERFIAKQDAEKVIRNAAIILVDYQQNEERWRLSGRDPDGDRLDVVIALHEHENTLIAVVTVID